jgi:hypothetical protein
VGNDYRNGAHFLHGYRIALMLCTGLLVVGAIGSALLIRNPAKAAAPAPHPEHHYDCAVCGPPVEQVAGAG